MLISCKIVGTEITEGCMAQDGHGFWYICQNKRNGGDIAEYGGCTHGYKNSWFLEDDKDLVANGVTSFKIKNV